MPEGVTLRWIADNFFTRLRVTAIRNITTSAVTEVIDIMTRCSVLNGYIYNSFIGDQ
ncbi:MAG: hypothetical protein HZA12_05035 [Nitrospirae bacterium]|nr:hypothetical protein [Nitrospirota bacterium]